MFIDFSGFITLIFSFFLFTLNPTFFSFFLFVYLDFPKANGLHLLHNTHYHYFSKFTFFGPGTHKFIMVSQSPNMWCCWVGLGLNWVKFPHLFGQHKEFSDFFWVPQSQKILHRFLQVITSHNPWAHIILYHHFALSSTFLSRESTTFSNSIFFYHFLRLFPFVSLSFFRIEDRPKKVS